MVTSTRAIPKSATRQGLGLGLDTGLCRLYGEMLGFMSTTGVVKASKKFSKYFSYLKMLLGGHIKQCELHSDRSAKLAESMTHSLR